MFSRKFLDVQLSLCALLLLLTILYRTRSVNANPVQVTAISRRDDSDSGRYPDDDEIREQLDLEEDRSVFFLSCTQEALNFAEKYNRTTYREALSPFFTKLRSGDADQYKDFLIRASRIFAESSSGTAYVLLPADEKTKDCSIWSSIQFPALIEKGSKVDRIMQVDCENFEEVQKIWPEEKEDASDDEESESDDDKSESDDEKSGSDGDSSDSDGGGPGGLKGPDINIDPTDISEPGSGPILKPKPGKVKGSDDKNSQDEDSGDSDESSSDEDDDSSDEESSDEDSCVNGAPVFDRLLQKRDGADDVCFDSWIFDEQWIFSFYLNERCSGATTGMAGNGPTSCQGGLLNGYADAYIVSAMTDKCEIKFFGDASCEDEIITVKEDNDKCTPSDESIGSWLVKC